MATQVERLIATFEARLTQFDKALKKAAGDSDSTFRKIETRGKMMERRLSGIVPNFGGFLAGMIPAVTAVGTLHATLSTLKEASELVDFAERVGLTTTAVQELEFGFSQAGVAAAEFRNGIEQFTDRIGDAATKGGRLADILKANGVALRDAEGRIRPTNQLLAAYADLVKNAGSEQEKMTLATEAFGNNAGKVFVNALNEGAAGLDRMAAKTAEFGGVIDEELLRRAKELDDRFAAMWRNFTVQAKSAILSADDELARFQERQRERGQSIWRWLTGDLQAGFAGRSRIDPTEAFRNRQLDTTEKPPRRTILPNLDDIRLREQTIKKTKETIDALTREYDALGKTNEQKRIANELAKAGVDASTKEGQAISELVRMIEAKENALEVTNKQMDDFARRQREAVEAAQYLGDTFEQTALSIVGGTQKASDALKEMAVQLAIAAAKAALLGTGPLAGLFGPRTLPGGDISPTIARQIAGGFGGLFADGGRLPAGKWGIAGERGPEIITGPATITPVSKTVSSVGAGGPVTFNIDARGAQAGVGEEIKRALDQYDAGSFARHVANNRRAQSRRMVS